MKTILQLAASLCLIAMGAAALYLAFVVAPGVRQDLAASENAIAGSVARATRDLERTATSLEMESAAWRGQLRTESEAWRATADQRLAQIGQTAGVELGRAASSLEHVAGMRDDLAPVLERTAAAVAMVNDTLPLYTDCEHNPDCAFNRFQGSSKAFERTMRAIAEAAPRATGAGVLFAEESAGIAADVHKLTAKVVAPQPLWKKITNGLVAAARLASGVF